METIKREENFYNKTAFPIAVRKEKNAHGAATLTRGEGELILKAGSFVVYDMGSASVGGYPVFSVKSYAGSPILRIAYSDRMLPFEREETMAMGDFMRNSCTYLGVEVPVMPANPHRFEEYAIARTGEYRYPLVQGQERFVLIYLDAEKNGKAESVSLSSFYVYDNSFPVSPIGYFESDSEELNRLWIASARTIRLATIRSCQWEKIENVILLRKLTFSSEGGVYKDTNGKQLTVTVKAEIYLNPTCSSGIGFLIFSDGNNGYKISITDNGKVFIINNYRIISEGSVGFSVANAILDVKIKANANKISVSINGDVAAEFVGKVKTGGSFGFYMQSEWRAILRSVTAIINGKVADGAFSTDNYLLKNTDYFISDGAKRDRLPWTGDLYWALDGAWYAFGTKLNPKTTFDILALHQNPEGFIFGTCYPENNIKPREKNYGLYQSDAFSVWFVISILYYSKLCGEDAKNYFQVMRRCMNYVWKYVDYNDGLFFQRYETSKGLWDHDLGDRGKITYTNLLICDAYKSLIPIAKSLKEYTFAEECRFRFKKMRTGILKNLYDKKAGGFIRKTGDKTLCELANPYALARGLVGKRNAKRISENVLAKTRAYGKIVTLSVRGLYDYGYSEIAEKILFGKTPCYTDVGEFYSNVDWVGAIGNADFPETVYECMHNPPYDFGNNLNWGDLSHPDSAINGIISAYIAGVKNAGNGFDRILIKPHPYKCGKIRCGVPVKRGQIEIKIEITDTGSNVFASVPKGTKVKTDFSYLKNPVRFSIEYNDKINII